MSARHDRIAAEIQRELSEVIRVELRDPRVKLVTLTGVELARDLAHAKVFFSTLGGSADAAEVTNGLRRAAGFLRSALAHRLTVRTVPQLTFEFDDSLERGNYLSQLIDRAVPPKA